MKKFFILILFLLLPFYISSETIFIPRLGLDLHKGFNKTENNTNKISSFSKTLSFGLDMYSVTHHFGFMVFLNNDISFIKSQEEYEKLTFEKNNYSKTQIKLLLSTEFLLGKAFISDSYMDIYFGLGAKTYISPKIFPFLKNIFNESLSNESVMIAKPALGGVIGLTYYLNDSLGVSFSISDFIDYGAFVFGDNQKESVTFKSNGFNNMFSARLGIAFKYKRHKKTRSDMNYKYVDSNYILKIE